MVTTDGPRRPRDILPRRIVVSLPRPRPRPPFPRPRCRPGCNRRRCGVYILSSCARELLSLSLPAACVSFSLEAARFYCERVTAAAAAAARIRCPFSARSNTTATAAATATVTLRTGGSTQARQNRQAGRQAAGSQGRAGGSSCNGRASVVPEKCAGSRTFRPLFFSF